MAQGSDFAAEAEQVIVFADESGDTVSRNIDPEFPLFVLALCLFDVSYYIHEVCPQLQTIKFKYFGHDGVIFHERDIRKQRGPFSILRARSLRDRFQEDLTVLIDSLIFRIFAVVIDKRDYASSSLASSDMYSIAMEVSLSQLDRYLSSAFGRVKRTAVMFESRGRSEDRALERAFTTSTPAALPYGAGKGFSFLCIAKRSNSLGLQLSDLVARPLGIAALRPGQPNRAMDVLAQKIETIDTVSTITTRTTAAEP